MEFDRAKATLILSDIADEMKNSTCLCFCLVHGRHRKGAVNASGLVIGVGSYTFRGTDFSISVPADNPHIFHTDQHFCHDSDLWASAAHACTLDTYRDHDTSPGAMDFAHDNDDCLRNSDFCWSWKVSVSLEEEI